MRRFFIFILVICFLGGAVWIAWRWYGAQGISEDALALIPPNAIYTIASNDPISSWKEIAGSEAWSHLRRNAYFAELTSSANSLDSLIHKNDFLFDLIGSRALIISALMSGTRQYDFLFLVDLQEVSGIKFLKDYLSSIETEGFSVRKENYAGEDLIVLHDLSDNSNLYLSMPGSYLIASYTKNIIISALDSRRQTAPVSEVFIATGEDVGGKGIFQLYLNYSMLPRLVSCYSESPNEYINRLAQSLIATSLDVTLEKGLFRASGYTYMNDSVESYVKTLSVSGKGPSELFEIAPTRTAFCLGLGFTTFGLFFENFEKNLQQDVAGYKSYRENLGQVESYLNISMKDNVISWIGDEVALFELQSSGKGLDSEMALALKAANIEDARDNLEYIGKMIRRKTPVKFKTVEHRGHTINYLGMKGLFRILLGKFFARYDKPYYTIINNFVVFSNHPQTLESMIDDYLDKNTLIESEEFRSFKREFDDEGAAFVYLNAPVLFNSIKKLAAGPTRVAMETNKEFIVCFRQIGFQLVPEPGRFKTIFAEQFVAPPQNSTADSEPVGDDSESDSLTAAEVMEESEPVQGSRESDPMELPYIYVQDINASTFTGYAEDSTVHFNVELRNGFKDGSFTEYFPNGEVKLTGKFKRDKRDGIWRLHDESGKVIMRRNYEEGEVKREKMKD